MRILAVAATLTACALPPRSPPSNRLAEHRATVELGETRLTAAVPVGVPVYTNRTLLLWSTDELDTATIELRPPHVPSFVSVFVFPVPTAFEVDQVARTADRRIVGRTSTPAGPELAFVEERDALSIPSIVLLRADLGVVCEATAIPDAADLDGTASLEVGVRICESLQR